MTSTWKSFLSTTRNLFILVVSLVSTLLTLKIVSLFLCYNETRVNGYSLSDPVLDLITPRDISTLLFTITWVCIIIGLVIVMRTPIRALLAMYSIIVIGMVRCIVMYMVPLETPEGIIPLRDPMLEGSFYDEKVLVKDLFFSGHTSNMVILTLLMDIIWIKRLLIICTIIVAYLLLVQHVHYTIDVLAAPIFAYISYRIAKVICLKVSKYISKPKVLLSAI